MIPMYTIQEGHAQYATQHTSSTHLLLKHAALFFPSDQCHLASLMYMMYISIMWTQVHPSCQYPRYTTAERAQCSLVVQSISFADSLQDDITQTTCIINLKLIWNVARPVGDSQHNFWNNRKFPGIKHYSRIIGISKKNQLHTLQPQCSSRGVANMPA